MHRGSIIKRRGTAHSASNRLIQWKMKQKIVGISENDDVLEVSPSREADEAESMLQG